MQSLRWEKRLGKDSNELNQKGVLYNELNSIVHVQQDRINHFLKECQKLEDVKSDSISDEEHDKLIRLFDEIFSTR